MYILMDTFNDREISRHITLHNALVSANKFDRLIKRNNGMNSYIPTIIIDSVSSEEIKPHGEYERGLFAYIRITTEGEEYGIE